MIDVIGKLYTNIDLNEDPELQQKPELLSGFHINSTKYLLGLDDYLVSPETPRREFAGIDTIYYTFESEDQAKDLLNYNKDDSEYHPVYLEYKKVPEKIRAVDGLLVLDMIGLLDSVESYVSSDIASRAEKIIYNREPFWFRNDALVEGLGSMLGLTNQQIDDLFIKVENYKISKGV